MNCHWNDYSVPTRKNYIPILRNIVRIMTGYYDIVLGMIPLALATITAALSIAGFSLTTAVPLASLVAVGLIGHAMFVRTPVDAPAPSRNTGFEPAD